MVLSDQEIEEAARRFGLSASAGKALFAALEAGQGRQAQFSHPDLGGMGQWSGGLTQIGDMFNQDLKARVAGFCDALASRAASPGQNAAAPPLPAGQRQRQGGGGPVPSRPPSPWSVAASDSSVHGGKAEADAPGWWPAHLGLPSATGAQNGTAYAVFPDRRRLAVNRAGVVTLLDTANHRLDGAAQQQGGSSTLSFSGPDGPVPIDQFREVDR